MSEVEDKLKASKPAAMAAKDAFVAKFVKGRHDRSVGIGLNRTRSDWAVKVYAQCESAFSDMPDTFSGFDVDVQVTGAATARR